MKLLIVESPAKTKTISKYLGKEYTVKASVGHIRDLPKSSKNAIDIEGGFIPNYEISAGKEKVVSDLRNAAKKADEVLLATDPDREGEAIAWHVAEAIGLKNPKRIIFNEITESAVKEALKHPREIDLNLKEAQEARRVLDRIFGYDLSGLIWKKVRYGLSAGRVQSPALRILMEREKEIRAFEPEKFWTLFADLETKNKEQLTFTCSEEPRGLEKVEKILKIGKVEKWSVVGIKETEQKRTPKAPFITSTLQQTASTRLGFAPYKTMGVAQKLYEAGHITYMRTDSTTLSKDALSQIFSEIEGKYGKDYIQARVFKTRSKNAQEAHEAVRPSKISRSSAGTTPEQKKLYELIRNRTIASQMVDAKVLRTKITANVESKSIPDFQINGSRLMFEGWLKADPQSRGEEIELPKMNKDDLMKLLDIKSEEKETQPPSRYTEAGLIKELEKRGLGRPSTYASIINTIVKRGYVDKEGRTLFPTDTGDVVNGFLEKHFTKYISDSFTADLENELDEIADGKRAYLKTMSDFYKPFKKDVDSKEDIEKVTTLGDVEEKIKCPKCEGKMVYKLSRNGKFMSCAKFPECAGARTSEGDELAEPKELDETCPKCEKSKLVEREGRFGKFVACGNYPKCKYVKKDASIDPSKLTGVKCPKCDKGEMMEKTGRFGIFFSCSNYPDCKNAIKAKPTGKFCDYEKETKKCGALMMGGTKTIPERCSDKTCPNHNPHKLTE